MSFLSAKDCFVAQTQDLLVPEPVVDCLTNIAVGCPSSIPSCFHLDVSCTGGAFL